VSADPASVHPLIRPLNWGDLDRIMEIELAAYPFPWTRGIFSDCIRVGYDCWGLQVGSRLIGYSIQTDAAGEAHLLNLCIEPGWQRKGFGGILLQTALRIARSHGCSSMFLEVRPSNPAGIALYRSHGFVIVGSRPGYYSAGGSPAIAAAGESAARDAGDREDALVMQLELQD
jgi:ribosomal-protein-alanine N-acetyltransferase